MILTQENYFSKEANLRYMSSTQFKLFRECEAMAMAWLRGDWKRKTTEDMMKGKYVHAWNGGTLPEFLADPENAECFKTLSIENIMSQIPEHNMDTLIIECPKIFKDGNLKKGVKKDTLLELLEHFPLLRIETKVLKSTFSICNKIIHEILKDDLLKEILRGEKEKIFTAEMFGCDWKVMIDSYYPEKNRFADLKILQNLDKKFWDNEPAPGMSGMWISQFEHLGYLTQPAIYSTVEMIANGSDELLEPFLAVITKEEYPDKGIVSFSREGETYQTFIRDTLATEVEPYMERINGVKSGGILPQRCGKCNYCKSTKVLTGAVHYSVFSPY